MVAVPLFGSLGSASLNHSNVQMQNKCHHDFHPRTMQKDTGDVCSLPALYRPQLER